tara:strand:- start:1667 stop:1906 length:240 start_codon:yes stop_codon:yes gene_type:complete
MLFRIPSCDDPRSHKVDRYIKRIHPGAELFRQSELELNGVTLTKLIYKEDEIEHEVDVRASGGDLYVLIIGDWRVTHDG